MRLVYSQKMGDYEVVRIEIPWTEEPVGYSPRGRVELDPTE